MRTKLLISKGRKNCRIVEEWNVSSSLQFPPELQLLHLLEVTQFAIGQMQFLLERCILHAFDGVFLREGQYLQSQFVEFLSAD